jgi:hypothetical protein
MPPPPRQDESSLAQRLRDAFSAFFPDFPPTAAAAPVRGATQGAEPASVELADGNILVELDVDVHSEAQELRDLFCRVEALDEENQTRLPGAPLWLQVEESGAVIQEQALDDLGDAMFTGLQPGAYTLLLHIGGQDYAIRNVIIL